MPMNRWRTHYLVSKDEWYASGGLACVGAYRKQLSDGRWLHFLPNMR